MFVRTLDAIFSFTLTIKIFVSSLVVGTDAFTVRVLTKVTLTQNWCLQTSLVKVPPLILGKERSARSQAAGSPEGNMNYVE